MTDAYDFDYIVIGSGFGGSVSALRLSEKGYSVAVLEMGKRWRPQDFPKTNMNLRKYLWLPIARCFGIQQITFLKDVYILHGAGVGGGSLVYANTLLKPPSRVFDDPRWPSDDDWEAKLAPYYDLAQRMLGAVPAKDICRTDELLRDVVDPAIYDHDTFQRHTVSVFYGNTPGETVPDPFFGGEGPDRSACIQCGECMSGCKHDAKNSLDKNYLYLAEKRGARVFPETKAVDIRPIPGGGYEVHTIRSTALLRRTPRVLRARGVVVSASVLGTVKLLMQCKDRGSLPNLSGELGNYVRTNAESFGIVTQRKGEADPMKGIAITSGVFAPDGTHIEAVRFGKGQNYLGTMTGPLVPGGGPGPRWLTWLKTLLRHPLRSLKAYTWRDWANRSVALRGMKPRQSYLRLRLKKGPSLSGLGTDLESGEPIEAYLPVVHEATRRLAQRMEGDVQGSVFEAVFDNATTAHILGGATMGRSPDEGVCDAQGRVFGYDNLYVCDGSIVPANLTVNPSLTITALSEYVMSTIPPKDGAEQRPVTLTQPSTLDVAEPAAK